MKQLQHAIELGATMYIPATHEQLWEVTEGIKFPILKIDCGLFRRCRVGKETYKLQWST